MDTCQPVRKDAQKQPFLNQAELKAKRDLATKGRKMASALVSKSFGAGHLTNLGFMPKRTRQSRSINAQLADYELLP